MSEARMRAGGNGVRDAHVGFLTVLGDVDDGFVGGLLALDARGRPVEFHCTAPLRPNRAQIILYGATLRSYIVAEQLAPVLHANLKHAVGMLWVDDGDVLPMREAVDIPLAWVRRTRMPGDEQPRAQDFHPSLVAVPHPQALRAVLSNDATQEVQQEFWVHPGYAEDPNRVRQLWAELGRWIDCHEPFERIREAIGEAQKAQVRSA